jgi:hypothetical protein
VFWKPHRGNGGKKSVSLVDMKHIMGAPHIKEQRMSVSLRLSFHAYRVRMKNTRGGEINNKLLISYKFLQK